MVPPRRVLVSRLFSLLAVTALVAFGLVDGCGSSSSSPDTPSGGAGSGNQGGTTPSSGAGGNDGGKAGTGGKPTGGQGGKSGQGGQNQGGQGGQKMVGCTGIPRPATVPDDWIEYTGWDCMCPLYAAGNSKIRPPKIEWGLCDFKLPESYKCERTVKPGKGWMAAFNYSAKDPETGELLFQTGFTEDVVETLQDYKTTYGVVARENGELVSHFLQVRTDKCGSTGSGLSSKTLIRNVNPAFNPYIEGAIAANLTDTIPTREMKFEPDPALLSSWSVTPSWIIRQRGDRTAYRWDDPSGKETLIYTASMLGRAGHRVVSHNNDIFINVGEIHSGGVAVWTEKTGTKPLILWPAGERTVHDFNTDGEHLVWTEAQGWDNATTTFAISDVYVAPYSLEQDQVSKTRKKLTADPYVLGGTPWQVGCGYAARGIITSNPSALSLRVVRLSDGYSWLIPGGDVSKPWRYDLYEAFGMTCQHIYITVNLPSGAPTIVRIRLDSLGPGTPPP